MELALNLVWVLLAALALGRWSRGRHTVSSLSQLIALACMLALLFPVISATDDLHAMRPEIEDSASNKRLKQAIVGKAFGLQMTHSPAALLVAPFVVFRPGESSRLVIPVYTPAFSLCSCMVKSSRAPPLSEIA
jgi:hypothetical protein